MLRVTGWPDRTFVIDITVKCTGSKDWLALQLLKILLEIFSKTSYRFINFFIHIFHLISFNWLFYKINSTLSQIKTNSRNRSYSHFTRVLMSVSLYSLYISNSCVGKRSTGGRPVAGTLGSRRRVSVCRL